MAEQPNTKRQAEQFRAHLGEALALALDGLGGVGLAAFLTGAAQGDKYTSAFAKHKVVFDVVRPATFSLAILSLHKLSEDARGHPVSLLRCLSMAEQISLISTDRRKALKRRLRELQPILKRVAILRHQLIAHRDCSISVSKVFEDAALSLKDLTEVAQAYWEILMELRGAAEGKAFDATAWRSRLPRAVESFMNDLMQAQRK
jgi:hypothetical protein